MMEISLSLVPVPPYPDFFFETDAWSGRTRITSEPTSIPNALQTSKGINTARELDPTFITGRFNSNMIPRFHPNNIYILGDIT
jgi:hypothetical protein